MVHARMCAHVPTTCAYACIACCAERSLLRLQVIGGFPLLLPFKILHAPSIFLWHCVSKGNGRLIGGTVTAIGTVIMATSIWEAIGLDRQERESDAKCEPQSQPVAVALESVVSPHESSMEYVHVRYWLLITTAQICVQPVQLRR